MRVAVVTGGAAGMGRAISLRLAADGHAVGIIDVDLAGAEAVAGAIAAQGGRACAVQGDIGDRAQVEEAIRAIRVALGPVAVLVNNAAIENFTALEDLDDASWDRLMAINLRGAYVAAQCVLPDMTAAGWGRIVNISAFGAQIGAPNMALYTASKGGIIAMTRSLAIELGPRGITVNSVSPGFIDTPMARRAIDGGLFPVPWEQIVATYPIARLGQPEDIAAACAFFASDAAGYVTGQVLGVNGGAAM